VLESITESLYSELSELHNEIRLVLSASGYVWKGILFCYVATERHMKLEFQLVNTFRTLNL